MKLIHKFKSPNFDERKSDKVNSIIIHYTALKSIKESIKYLCSKKNKVSSHYLISKNGRIYNLVSEKKRAWHAGKSYWKGNNDINSSSIGIELDFYPSTLTKKYNKNLLFSLIKLLKKIKKKYHIQENDILGHSDIAPYRKIDPGKNFPWYLLQENSLAFEIKNFNKEKTFNSILGSWFKKNKFKSKKKRIIFMLDIIGYDISMALKNKTYYNMLIEAYSSRHIFYKNFTYNNKEIFYVIQLHFMNILLTKLKK